MTEIDNTTARLADQTEPAQRASAGGSWAVHFAAGLAVVVALGILTHVLSDGIPG